MIQPNLSSAVTDVLREGTAVDRKARIAELLRKTDKVRADIAMQEKLDKRSANITSAFVKINRELGKTLTDQERRAINGMYFFVHDGCVDMVRRAKKTGLAVTCEATPHHLLLTEDDVARLGANAKMKPPLRTEADRGALVEALKDGTVDAIATDHAPHAAHEKKDFATAAYGVIGMETAFPACMQLVHRGDVKFERLIELFTTGPARVAKLLLKSSLPSREGVRGRGTVSIDPNASFTVDPAKFQSKSRNTPFANLKLKGRILGVSY